MLFTASPCGGHSCWAIPRGILVPSGGFPQQLSRNGAQLLGMLAQVVEQPLFLLFPASVCLSIVVRPIGNEVRPACGHPIVNRAPGRLDRKGRDSQRIGDLPICAACLPLSGAPVNLTNIGLQLTNNRDGTATLSGTPTAGGTFTGIFTAAGALTRSGGTAHLTAKQTFTLLVLP